MNPNVLLGFKRIPSRSTPSSPLFLNHCMKHRFSLKPGLWNILSQNRECGKAACPLQGNSAHERQKRGLALASSCIPTPASVWGSKQSLWEPQGSESRKDLSLCCPAGWQSCPQAGTSEINGKMEKSMLRSGKPLPVATAQSSEGDSAQGSLGLLQALQGCQSQQRYGGRKLPVHATQSLTPPSAVSTGQEHIPAPAPFLSIPQNSRKGKTEADTTPVPEEGRNETRLPACSFLSDMQPKLPHSLHATPVTWTPSSNIQYP